MAYAKPTISLEPDLYAEAKDLARVSGVSFSELVGRALEDTLSHWRALLDVAELEIEMGSRFDEEELRQAASETNLDPASLDFVGLQAARAMVAGREPRRRAG